MLIIQIIKQKYNWNQNFSFRVYFNLCLVIVDILITYCHLSNYQIIQILFKISFSVQERLISKIEKIVVQLISNSNILY